MDPLFPQEAKLTNGQTLLIAEAEPADAKEIVEYLNQIGGESHFLTFGRNEFWISAEGEGEFIETLHRTGQSLMLKGVLEGKIVSTVTLMVTDRRRLLHLADFGISVLSKYWCLGIARAMMEASLQWAHATGLRKINLRGSGKTTRGRSECIRRRASNRRAPLRGPIW